MILFLIVIEACTFNSEEQYFVEIDQDQIIVPTLDFFQEADTLYLRGSQNIDFSARGSVIVTRYEFLIGNTVIFSGNSVPTRQFFQSSDFEDGIYLMTFRVYSESNSGSLADELGLEEVITTTTKFGIIDNAPVIPDIIGFVLEDSTLTFQWIPYDSYLFEGIEINFSAPYSEYDQILNTNEFSSIAIDKFSGGSISANYRLSAKNETASENIRFEDDFDVDLSIDQGKLKVTLQPNPYRSFLRYELIHKNSLNSSQDLDIEYILEDRTSGDELLDLDDSFPQRLKFEFYVLSEDLTTQRLISTDFDNDLISVSAGDTYLNYFFYDEFFIKKTISSNITVPNLFEYYDLQNNTLTQSVSGNYALSPKGNYMYELRDSILIQYDPANLVKIDAFNINAFIDFEGETRKIFVSDGNQLIFYNFIEFNPFGGTTRYRSYHWDNNNKELRLTKTLISSVFQNSNEVFVPGGKLSDSGNYFFNEPPSNDISAKYFISLFPNNSLLLNLLGSFNKRGLVLSSDTYVHVENNSLVKRDLFLHEVQQELQLEETISSMICNDNDLCALILNSEEGSELCIVDVVNMQELTRKRLNSTVENSTSSFIRNTFMVKGSNNKLYKWHIDE